MSAVPLSPPASTVGLGKIPSPLDRGANWNDVSQALTTPIEKNANNTKSRGKGEGKMK